VEADLADDDEFRVTDGVEYQDVGDSEMDNEDPAWRGERATVNFDVSS
jgi:hypothetical protein